MSNECCTRCERNIGWACSCSCHAVTPKKVERKPFQWDGSLQTAVENVRKVLDDEQKIEIEKLIGSTFGDNLSWNKKGIEEKIDLMTYKIDDLVAVINQIRNER